MQDSAAAGCFAFVLFYSHDVSGATGIGVFLKMIKSFCMYSDFCASGNSMLLFCSSVAEVSNNNLKEKIHSYKE